MELQVSQNLSLEQSLELLHREFGEQMEHDWRFIHESECHMQYTDNLREEIQCYHAELASQVDTLQWSQFESREAQRHAQVLLSEQSAENRDKRSEAEFFRAELERTNKYWAEEAKRLQTRLRQEVSVCTERMAEVQLQILTEANVKVLTCEAEAQSDRRARQLSEQEMISLPGALGSAHVAGDRAKRAEKEYKQKWVEAEAAAQEASTAEMRL